MPSKGTSRWALWTVAVLTGALFYGLSIGPACWLTAQAQVSAQQVGAVYRPWLWLDSVAPDAIRDRNTSYVALWGAGREFEEARATVVTWESYPVGDLTYRVEQGQRHFRVDPWFVDLILSTVAPESWDEVGGIGRVLVDPAQESLRVLQSRKGHAAVAEHLRELRRLKEAWSMDGIDLDQQKLFRALFGYRFMQKDLLPGTLFIHEDWDGKLSAAGRGFDDIEGLIPFLDEIPVEVLKSGICWHSCNDPHPGVMEELTAFCEARHIDLFSCRDVCFCFGACWESINWVVRAQNSPYFDSPDDPGPGRGSSHPFQLIPWPQAASTSSP